MLQTEYYLRQFGEQFQFFGKMIISSGNNTFTRPQMNFKDYSFRDSVVQNQMF